MDKKYAKIDELYKEPIPGQTSFDVNGVIHEDGELVDLNQEHVVLEYSEEEQVKVMSLLKTKNFDIRYFSDVYEDNSNLALKMLLRLQSNFTPLKKGGSEIGYRADVIILKNKQKFKEKENTVLDIICAEISSRPEDDVYYIPMSQIKKRLHLSSEDSYIYEVIHDGIEELKKEPFEFQYIAEDGVEHTLSIPWYEYLDNTKRKNDEFGIYVKPSAFFKMLTISSTITHGAHYRIDTAYNLREPAKSIYYYLESKKNTKPYPDAPEEQRGNFHVSLQEFREMFSIPLSYNAAKIKSRFLDKARRIFEEEDSIDITFDYIFTKKKGVFEGIDFSVKPIIDTSTKEHLKDLPKKKEKPALPDLKISELSIEIQLLETYGYDQKSINDILKKYKYYKRDVKYLTKAILYVEDYKGDKNKTGLLCYFMKNDIEDKEKMDKKNNTFHNFNQRTYNYDELEKRMLDRSKDI